MRVKANATWGRRPSNTNASGNATFTNVALTSAVTAGEVITATTTSAASNGNTSEFSQGIVATVSTGNSTPSANQVVTSNGGGISLNTDGGTDAYLVSTSGLSSALSAYTVEVKFAGTDTGGDIGLFSYNTTAGDLISIQLAGTQLLMDVSTTGTVYSSATNYRTLLFDGQTHTISASWTSATGAWALYVDGTLRDSGTGISTGATIAAGGTFVFGQEQDTQGGGFDVTQRFSGTLYDARVFNSARTASQILASYNSHVPRLESGLVADWRFDDLSSAGVTTEAVAGNNLTVGHVTVSGFTTSTPTLSLQLNENSTTGTRVGSVDATDIERDARIAALLSADSSLRYSAETQQFYKVISSAANWSTAQSGATTTTLNGVGGQLATITSVTENALVTSMLTTSAWLGGSDVLNEGAWRWYSGASAGNQFWQGTSTGHSVNNSYTNFAGGEPNDWSGIEEYLEINTGGQWNDNSSTATNSAYVVEWNADDVLDATNALTYTITSQTVSGAFAINSDTGVITVADGTKLDFETNSTHTLTVRVSDGTNTFDKNFTVSLNDLNETNAAPTDMSSGINLNTDGGNNAYLMTTSGGTVFGGRTALTLEVSYTMLNNASSESPFVSYAVPAGADNEVYLRVTPGGILSLAINGTVSSTTSAYSQLVDGKQHSVAVSWDNTNGDVLFYIDGQFVQMNTGVKAGTTIAAGGTLVLGQEQDAPNANFNTAQRFSGTLHEVRVWDRAISGEQISQNYQQKLGSTPTGLVADWRMTGFNGSNQVVDEVGGINLSVANVTGGGWTTSTPTASLSVSENATVGTIVGSVVATEAMNTRDIVADGLFREAANPGTVTSYSSGQTFGNWTVQSGNVELLGTAMQSSPLGGRSVDLNGSAAGAISQVLSTTAGRQYQVVFNTSGNWLDGEATKDFRVSAGGTSQDYSLTQPSGWSSTNVLFSGRSMTFTATGSSTTLAFQSLDSGNSGALIADVRVIEIPAAVQAVLNSDSTLTFDAATGKFYKSVASNQTFTAAQSAATSTTLNGVSGQMVTIGSSYENELVWSLARNLNSNVWLGASDAGVEGTWRWNTGATASSTFWVGTSTGTLQTGAYANWVSGDPNDSGGNEDYLSMSVTAGQWNDVIGTNARYYIVEFDASEVLSNVTYTITSDPSGAFAINSNTGEITVGSASPLSEIATDPTITVRATDAFGNTYSEAVTIAVNRVNDNTPIISSNGGGATAAINVAENITSVATVVASDADLPTPTLNYSIVGGADSAKFTINSSTGALAFASAPDFETPTDSGSNNVYDVVVRASDGTNFDDQSLAITITNVNEAPTDLYNVPSVTDANVLGYYSFSSANNLGRDDAGGTSPITFTGTVAQTTSPSGSGALDISGGAYGNIASMTTGGAMTISSWVKFDSTSANGFERIIDLGQANSGGIGNIYIGRLGTTNDLTFTIEKYGIYTHRATLTNGITNGTWMHVAGTVDAAGNMTLYVNGAAVATATGVAPDVGVRTNQFIGRSNFAVDGAFDGAIDDLLITSGNMSAASIANLYQQSNAFSIAENTANGTLLTTVYATDPDAANTYTYSLIDDPSGAFAINSANGQLTVNNSSQLNFEGDATLSVTVRATDQNGLSRDETIAINLSDVNESPTFSTGSGRNYTSISGMQFGNAVAQQTDGKYVMAGWSDSGGTRDFAVIRYNLDGSLDTTFGSGNGYVITAVGTSSDEAQDIRVLSSGKILVQGYAINGGSNDIAFVQYNSDGSLDTSFGGGHRKSHVGHLRRRYRL